MTVYVETNFVLEMALFQEQHWSCEGIVSLAVSGAIRCVVPAFSLMEPYATLSRRQSHRNRVQGELAPVLRELRRTAPYATPVKAAEQALSPLLADSEDDELVRLRSMRRRLETIAEVVPLDLAVLAEASSVEVKYGLSAQDAVVFASVRSHLERTRPARSCFINRNSKDFDTPELTRELLPFGCKLFSRFDTGLQYVRHLLGRAP